MATLQDFVRFRSDLPNELRNLFSSRMLIRLAISTVQCTLIVCFALTIEGCFYRRLPRPNASSFGTATEDVVGCCVIAMMKVLR